MSKTEQKQGFGNISRRDFNRGVTSFTALSLTNPSEILRIAAQSFITETHVGRILSVDEIREIVIDPLAFTEPPGGPRILTLQKDDGQYDHPNEIEMWNSCGPACCVMALKLMRFLETGKVPLLRIQDILNEFKGKSFRADDKGKTCPYIRDDNLMSVQSVQVVLDYFAQEKDYPIKTDSINVPTCGSDANTTYPKRIPELVSELNRKAFTKGGVVIGFIQTNSYLHFTMFTDISIKRNEQGKGQVEAFVVDPLGKDGKGRVGWVNFREYVDDIRRAGDMINYKAYMSSICVSPTFPIRNSSNNYAKPLISKSFGRK
ncbi:hypothetical protein A2Z22_03720 [Candidatus Woesebacteria bacterium RBG_16_34_12]|uniref:Uncharacterized protein n=1 Tax=Candidatus Woesebacteria bacterium RBG_16_34_12 TaxID=1802480 RepID=A0A1F7X857_9BACT|nr:MAG: hypothetical protein A2Z22_03720 [Candidatus Woesebacteria bacterium RBG_16_34_12]